MLPSALWWSHPHRRLSRLLPVVFGYCVLVPCVAVAQQSARADVGQGAPLSARASRDANVIGMDQLRSHPDLPTAYAMVEALHSNWLRERRADPPSGSDGRLRRIPEGLRAPAGENAGVQVYLDGHRLGGVALLKNIPSVAVSSIRHLSANEAQARYGAGHSHGVIVVTTMAVRP